METKKRFHETTKNYFDQEAENYDNSHDGRFVRCMYGEIIKRTLKLPGDKILDLGCGNGNIIRLLQKEREAEYYGVDLSAQMIEEARKRVKGRVEFKVGNAVELPYKDSMFDIIICNASFHHYTEPDRAVSEIKRVLRTEGTLILGDPTIPGKLPLKLLNWFLHQGNSGDFRIYGKKDIIPLFTENDFSVHQWNYINYKSFVMNAVKNSGS